MRLITAVHVVALAIAALGPGCPRTALAPCGEETCRRDCEAVGLSGGLCAGGACQCSPPGDRDADADADAPVDADLDQADAEADADGLVVLPECEGGAPRCANDWFLCTSLTASVRHCEGQVPALGGEPGWACEVRSGAVIACAGTALPTHAVGFECTEPTEGDARCNRHLYTPAERPAGDWACWYERDLFLVCESTGSPPPPENCCVPGAWRYCDTPTYCNWGTQHCAEDGLSWGPCDETSTPAACAAESWYSTTAEACCIDAGHCCQDMWDLDGDGDNWESLGACDGVVCGT